MLGKTANGLFWMYRYLERAENVSRLVETGQRIALTRLGPGEGEWRSFLRCAGVSASYDATHDQVTRDDAIDWLLRSQGNPSSVLAAITVARQNARMVRTALTHEVWEAMNRTYMQAQNLLSRKVAERELPGVLGAMRQGTALVRGATHGTMLRNDIYNFARIGTFLERAENTARILDEKYYSLLPSVTVGSAAPQNVQWETILRAVSARGGFRLEFGGATDPREIAQFLILDLRFPRSLAFCTNKILANIGFLVSSYGATPECFAMADAIKRQFLSQDIDAVFEFGLREFVDRVLSEIASLGRQVEIDYRFYE